MIVCPKAVNHAAATKVEFAFYQRRVDVALHSNGGGALMDFGFRLRVAEDGLSEAKETRGFAASWGL